MCGIAGIFLRDPSFERDVDLDAMLDTMIDKIDHRGGDATGYLALDSAGVAEWQRAACNGDDFIKNRRRVPAGTRTILAHTRWATQGLPAFMENNHPIRRGAFYVIHNGHVSNDQEMFKLSNRERFGQVDSEAIPARFASLGGLEFGTTVMADIEGGAAIAAVDERRPDELLLARGYSSPLFMLVTDKVVIWGSTHDAVKVSYTKHIGKLPKKRQIENVPEGTMIHFVGRKQLRSEFLAYKPAATTYTTHGGMWRTWQEIEGDRAAAREAAGDACLVPVASHLPKVGGWPKWDDVEEERVNCDVCGTKCHWTDAEYVVDNGITWTLCDLCDTADLDDELDRDLDLSTEDVAAISEALLND